jgi:predicted phage tail protein
MDLIINILPNTEVNYLRYIVQFSRLVPHVSKFLKFDNENRMQRLLNIIDKSRVSKDILKINVHSLLKLEKIIDYKERLNRDNHIINNNKRDVHTNENDNNNVNVSYDDEHRDGKNYCDFDDHAFVPIKRKREDNNINIKIEQKRFRNEEEYIKKRVTFLNDDILVI